MKKVICIKTIKRNNIQFKKGEEAYIMLKNKTNITISCTNFMKGISIEVEKFNDYFKLVE